MIICLVVDVATGAVAQRLEYDEFGNVLFDSNPGCQPFAYAGGLYDCRTGLIKFGKRDYDAEVGRWTFKDPVGFDGMDANFYGYVGQDPINAKDPNGLWKASGHEDLTRKAMSTMTFSGWQIQQAVWANVDRDVVFNQLNNTAHYMPGYSKFSDELIEKKLELAIAWEQAGYDDWAMYFLGQGLHTVQDKWSHDARGEQGTLGAHLTSSPDDPNNNPTFYQNALSDSQSYITRFLSSTHR